MQETVSSPELWQQPLTFDENVAVRNVLLPTDFSEFSGRALDFAAGIARRYEAQLHLFHCVDPTPFELADAAEQVQTACEDARRDLERLAEGLGKNRAATSLRANVAVTRGNLTAILPQTVRDLDVDLIVVGTHGRAGWKKLVLGSMAEAVIDQSPCPVLTVGPSTNRRRIQESGPSQILLAAAGSNRSQLASSYACSLACKYRSRLSVVDVLEDRAGRVLAGVSQFEWHEVAGTSDRPRTVALRLPPQIGTRSDLILRVSDETRADLIVLAVPADHRFTDRFLSTDSYRIVSDAACPVLTFHGGADRGPGQ